MNLFETVDESYEHTHANNQTTRRQSVARGCLRDNFMRANAEIVVLEMGTHEAKIVTIFETILWFDLNFFRMSLVERESAG